MNLPTQITEWSQRVRTWWTEARPVQRYGVLGGAGTVAVLILIMVAVGGRRTEWPGAILYAELDYQEAAEVSRRLREIQIRHRLTADASAILVPEDEVRDLQLQLAGEGYPRTGRVGYEIFDRSQLAMTDFLQKVNLKRALQDELAETLERIQGVRSARVHLVIPEPSLFSDEQHPVTAAVTLALARNVRLERRRIEAVAYLVAASVEGLHTENVVIVDDTGTMLSEERDPFVKMAHRQFELQRQIETALERKVQSLMDQVIGDERSRVRINAELDFNQMTTQTETVDPGERQIIISEEISETRSAERGTEEHAIRNYEVSRTLQNIVGQVGRVSRLSLALTIDQTRVIVDPASGQYIEEDRSAAEIDNLANLAREAVGFSTERGDRITVLAIPFDKTQELRAKAEEEARKRKEFWTGIAINMAKIMGIIAALITLRYIIQAIGRGVGVEEELQDLGETQDAAADEFERTETPHDMILNRIQHMVHERPDDAARLIRTMLLEESQ